MQRVFEPDSLLQANLLVAVLASEGILAYVDGADLLGGMGELPAMGLLGLRVADEDAEQALRLIREYLQAQPCTEGLADNQLTEGLGTLWC